MSIPTNWREAFKNLYAVIPENKNNTAPLPVSINSSATRLLPKGHYSKFHYLFKCLSFESKTERLEERFIVNAHIAFRKEVPDIFKNAMYLMNALRSLGNGLPVGVEEAIPRLEAKLSHWNADTYPFLKIIHRDPPPVLKSFLLKGCVPRQIKLKKRNASLSWLAPFIKLLEWAKQSFFKPHLFKFNKGARQSSVVRDEIKIRRENQRTFEEDRARIVFPFGCERLFKIMEIFHSYMEIRQRLNRPIPFEPLFRLFEGKNLSGNQEYAIKSFLKAYEDHKPKLPPRHLHALLKLILNLIPSEKHKHTLSTIELKFLQYGCYIFYRKDPQQLRWRSKLEEGIKLSLPQESTESTEIELGKELESKKTEKDNRWQVFEIKEWPDRVLVTGNNRQIIAIEELLSRSYGYYFLRPRLIYFEPEGKFAIVEKLCEQVYQRQWKIESDKISKEDEDVLIRISDFIKTMCADGLTPQKLHKKYLFSDQQHALKYLKISIAGDFDFGALERFCQIGPLQVSAFLMEKSGLYKHPFTKYFRTVLEASFKNPAFSYQDAAAQEGIADDRVIKQAKKLVRRSKKIRNAAYKEIKHIYKPTPEEKREIRQEISSQIVKIHKSIYAAGYLRKEIQPKVVAEILKKYGNFTAHQV